MFHNCEGQSHKTVFTDHNFSRERRAEADSNRGPSAYQAHALPLGQTGSPKVGHAVSRCKPAEYEPRMVSVDVKHHVYLLYHVSRFGPAVRR